MDLGDAVEGALDRGAIGDVTLGDVEVEIGEAAQVAGGPHQHPYTITTRTELPGQRAAEEPGRTSQQHRHSPAPSGLGGAVQGNKPVVQLIITLCLPRDELTVPAA